MHHFPPARRLIPPPLPPLSRSQWWPVVSPRAAVEVAQPSPQEGWVGLRGWNLARRPANLMETRNCGKQVTHASTPRKYRGRERERERGRKLRPQQRRTLSKDLLWIDYPSTEKRSNQWPSDVLYLYESIFPFVRDTNTKE